MIQSIPYILDILNMLDVIDLQTYICCYKVSKIIYLKENIEFYLLFQILIQQEVGKKKLKL